MQIGRASVMPDTAGASVLLIDGQSYWLLACLIASQQWTTNPSPVFCVAIAWRRYAVRSLPHIHAANCLVGTDQIQGLHIGLQGIYTPPL